jgi:hypothetical protein
MDPATLLGMVMALGALLFEGSNPRALRVRLQSLLPPSEARHTAA